MIKEITESILEAIAFIFIIMIIFNTLIEFLNTLHIFEILDIKLIGILSIFLAINNIFTKKFFGFVVLR